MIVLDTNVLSELMRPSPDSSVVSWVAAQPTKSLFTTSITQSEIYHGILLLAPGKRRTKLESLAEEMFREDFQSRVLSFASDTAMFYAEICVDRQRMGKPISQSDAQIAAIAKSAGATVATRNVSDFESCGISLLNPWSEKA